MSTQTILPRARLRDVLLGRSPLIGARCTTDAPRGLVSPVEPRIALGIPYGDLAADERARLQSRTLRGDLGTLARAAAAAALASHTPSPPARPFIVSARVDNLTIESALEALFQSPCALDPTKARFVHFVHPHALNVAATDPDLASRFARADLVLPDGVGLRIAARMLGIGLRHNLNGTDLLPLLCERAAATGTPVVLIGAAPGIAERCAERLRSATPDLRIELVSHGYLSHEESCALAARIRALPAPLVLVAMGTPVQERWAWRYLTNATGATVITVGGLFDFYSGRIPRAPPAWREAGLEWLFRLRQEPKRLGARYLLGNPLFLARAVAQRLRSARRLS